MVVPSEFGQYLPVFALNVTNIEIVFWCILLTDLGSLGGEILILILSLTLGWYQPRLALFVNSHSGDGSQCRPLVCLKVGDCYLFR